MLALIKNRVFHRQVPSIVFSLILRSHRKSLKIFDDIQKPAFFIFIYNS